MDLQVLILVAAFVIVLLMNAPIAIALGVSALLTMLSLGTVPSGFMMAQRMSKGIASFPLLAIPFFVLAGLLMGEGGMARRLVAFATAIAGQFKGGLAYITTITCMLFGAISGSATAALSSIGGIMIPEMTRGGYDRRFSVALTTTASTTGLVIPPSNIMIVYAVVTGNVSVAAMFMAGVLPGILVGLAIMIACAVMFRGKSVGESTPFSFHKVLVTGRSALPSLLLIFIVLGGILGGVFSPTEAAAVTVLYAFLLAVIIYKEVKLLQLPELLLRTGIITAVIFMLIATSQALGWVLALEQIPQSISTALLAVSDNPLIILLLINLLLAVGAVMDMTPAVLIFTPIFLPVVTELGMSPVHFGIMMIVNLCIGLCTPPVGTCLFVGCGVGKTTIAEVTKPMIPFLIAMFAALLAITYVPALSEWLPQAFGLLK